MKKNKITKEKITSLIKEEAEVIKRKKEIYDEVIKLNDELKEINENRGITGTFGFTGDMAKNASVSGFEVTPNISYIAQLEKEMGIEKEEAPINEEELLEIESLREENKTLKERLNKIEETLKSLGTVEENKTK
jgi:hypothetical protein